MEIEQEMGPTAISFDKHLPFSFAKNCGIVVAGAVHGSIRLVCREPLVPFTLLEARRYLGAPVTWDIVSSEEFSTILQRIYEERDTSTIDFVDEIGEGLDLQVLANKMSEPDDLLESKDDAPIVRLINGLVAEAVKNGASDIHIEPFEKNIRVRFRIDGTLRSVLRPALVLAPYLVSRIKIMSHLDIAEKRLPQDGRISLKIAGRAVDVRVSTIPSGYGERVVLRLLDKKTGCLNFEQLGMPEHIFTRMKALIHQPNGIILVTGPTGSGKTTSLYAALTSINDQRQNILTIEDPIEYFLEGIGQTQVNTKVNMTFARGLRAILRQDPDVVMVGEIRDLETASIAVQASLTGHLVLSTLHTNTAVGAITRLRDMGVEPFLLASTLKGAMAQRLVRILCPLCKRERVVMGRDRDFLGVHDGAEGKVYDAVGCESCHQTGYSGRTGIFQLIEVVDTIKPLIHNKAGEYEIEEALNDHSPSLMQEGITRILRGDTTIEEILRVCDQRGDCIEV